MDDSEILIDWKKLGKENDNPNEFAKLSLILDFLPFGISVQNKSRVVLYENKKARILTGSFKSTHCFSRWKHIKSEGDTICKDCPATIRLIDGNSHKFYRKTISNTMENLYIEIQTIPIIEKSGIERYIEIIYDVSDKIMNIPILDVPISKIIDDLQFSISIYGNTGGEMLLSDDLLFFDNPNLFIQKLSMFTYVGIFQNNFNREGLFGPLPVLDVTGISMMAYAFRMYSPNISDPRRNGMEPCLLFIYFKREYYSIFEKRLEILNFLDNEFKNKELEELTNEWFFKFKKEFKKFFSKQLNKFEFVHD